MSEQDRYQPLASYGPAEDLASRETFFHPEVSIDRLRESSRDISGLTHAWPGFQLVFIMHDGHQGRALSLWRNQQTLENYIARHQESVNDYVAALEPDNPWVAGVESWRTGTVDIHLVDASMPVTQGDLVVWSPPGAVRINEIRNLQDLDTLRDWWPMIATPAAPRSLVEVNGFQFFTAIRYPDNVYVTFLGFRSRNDLDAYVDSELHTLHDGPFGSADFRAELDIVTHTGRLLAWFQRKIGTTRFG